MSERAMGQRQLLGCGCALSLPQPPSLGTSPLASQSVGIAAQSVPPHRYHRGPKHGFCFSFRLVILYGPPVRVSAATGAKTSLGPCFGR